MNPAGKNINILRNAFQLTQQELGDLVKASKSKISRYEAGSEVPPYQAALLAKYFGCDATDLIEREISIDEAETLAKRAAEQKKTPAPGLELEDEQSTYTYTKPRQEEVEEDYDVKLAVHAGKVIDDILTRHKTPREAYAAQLKRNPRTLQRVIKGEIMATLPLAIRVATDFGESLEQFRLGPLPKGHMLRRIADQEQIIKAQAELIEALKK